MVGKRSDPNNRDRERRRGNQRRACFGLVLALSKEAMNFYSRSLAAEVGPKGVRVVNVLPGLIATVGAAEHHSATAAERCVGFL
ncbi:SDR family oxidoreductase [Cryobacterium sp. Y29]|uniref:SDR family oxidoreductase n=1 Tax=Cryobacterium sp. Y29 TaxID=2048285 RepID=UPI002101BF48|nr:SDR family oxidoreductase [Cryobacterium sp. Y29]